MTEILKAKLENIVDGFVSFIDSKAFKPFMIYGFILASSFVLPEKFVFDDESVIHLRQVLLYGATFFLVGWLIGFNRK